MIQKSNSERNIINTRTRYRGKLCELDKPTSLGITYSSKSMYHITCSFILNKINIIHYEYMNNINLTNIGANCYYYLHDNAIFYDVELFDTTSEMVIHNLCESGYIPKFHLVGEGSLSDDRVTTFDYSITGLMMY